MTWGGMVRTVGTPVRSSQEAWRALVAATTLVADVDAAAADRGGAEAATHLVGHWGSGSESPSVRAGEGWGEGEGRGEGEGGGEAG